MDLRGQLAELIKSRPPLFYLGTHQLRRAREEIVAAAAETGVEVCIYSTGTGSLTAGNKTETTDPLGVLEAIRKRTNQSFFRRDQVVWVLEYFHLLLREADPLVIGRLRDLIEFGRFLDTVVIVGPPNFALPPELADIPILRVGPPGQEEIREALNFKMGPDEKERAVQACRGLKAGEIENLVAMCLVRHGAVQAEALENLRGEWLEARAGEILVFEKPKVDFSLIGGLAPLKRWLMVREEVLQHPEAAGKAGLTPPRGILLTGVPGCGKSLMAQALGEEWGLPLLRLDPGRIYASGLGESEGRIRAALQIAVQSAPCIIWIDELEKAFSRTDPRTDGGVSNRILGALLHFLQERPAPVFLVATANDPSSLPPEFIRKGRWDEVFFIDLPGPEERDEIMGIILQGRSPALKPDKQWIALTEGFSGAEIRQAFEDAGYEAFHTKKPCSSFGLVKAIRETRPLYRLFPEEIDRIRSWGRYHARLANPPGQSSERPIKSRTVRLRPKGGNIGNF